MEENLKQLLLKDLCARLPYGVIVRYFGVTKELLGIIPSTENVMVGYDINDYEDSCIEDIKPYLRPMSSMTEEEKKEFSIFGFEVIDHINANRDECPKYQVIEVSNFSGITEITVWFNAHHFDYRGLIEKGLAIEAPEGMYKS